MADPEEFEYQITPSRLDDLGIDDPMDGNLGEYVSSYEMPSIAADYPPALPAGMAVPHQPDAAKSLNEAHEKHVRNGGSSRSDHRWTRDDHSDWLAQSLGIGSMGDSQTEWPSGGGLSDEFWPGDASTHEIVANDVLNKWEESPHWDEEGGPGAAWESPMGHRIERVARRQQIDPSAARGDWDDFAPFEPNVNMYPGNSANPMFHYELNGPGRGTEHYDTWDDAAETANWDAENLAEEIAGKTFSVGRHLDDLTRKRGMAPGSVPDRQMVRDAESRARNSY